MTIITDHKWKQFRYRYEVPDRVLRRDFDWCTPEDDYIDGFIHYRRRWYHVGEFERQSVIPGYGGFHADSFFSGVALRLSDDGETYQIATVIS